MTLVLIFVAGVVLAGALAFLVRELRPPAPLQAGGGPAELLEADVPRLTLESEPDDSNSMALTLFDPEAEVDPADITAPISFTAAGLTDVGRRRHRNEDSFLVDEGKGLFIVADGMGGHAGGDVASRLAVNTIVDSLASSASAPTSDVRRRGAELVKAIEAANARVHDEGHRKADLHGMGATVVAARISNKKQRLFVAHAGDSRCYRYRDGALHRLTRDHTLAELGLEGPFAKSVRRALGVKPSIKVDLFVDRPHPNDSYLLCSDGLTSMLSDAEIVEVLRAHGDDHTAATRALIDAANAKGGRDNTTVVIVKARSTRRSSAHS